MNWTCPYCDMRQTVTTVQRSTVHAAFNQGGGRAGLLGVGGVLTVCANDECQQSTVTVSIDQYNQGPGGKYRVIDVAPLLVRRLMPEGHAKPQPDYIPDAIVTDYREACAIRDLSPKASATLARRCLQGMIRHFGEIKVKGNRLYDEITQLKKNVEDGSAPRGVTVDSMDAIDAVRQVGNIGAHMEHDVDVIVDVDPDEAQTLIELIEALFEDWYIERHNREQRFARTVALASEKREQVRTLRGPELKPEA